MKTIFSFIALGVLLFTESFAQKTIEVRNTTNLSRTEIISIPYDSFTKHFEVDSIFTITDKDGKPYVHQLEKLGSLSPQHVLIQVNIHPNEILKLSVSKNKPEPFIAKTFARYVPERFDDFAWENDLVAFRLYGKALEGRKDDAQGMDFWAKRTSDLVINKWYKGDDYHKDHGEGLDYYAVGQTLGAGDIALYFDEQISYTKHYRTFDILDNGPIRTTFRLTFEPEEIAGRQVSLTKTITLDAGQQFNKITIALSNQQAKSTPIVLGIAKRKEDNPDYLLGKYNSTLSYWEPQINDSGETGVALILPKAKPSFINSEANQFLLQTTIQNGKPFTYYNGATWSRAGRYTSSKDWFDAVTQKEESLAKPLKVKLK